MATAFLLSNCHSMIIVIFRLVTGDTVTWMEALGVVISLGGVLLPLLMLHVLRHPHGLPKPTLYTRPHLQ